MTTLTDAQLAEIRARAEKATPGPWRVVEKNGIEGCPHPLICGPNNSYSLPLAEVYDGHGLSAGYNGDLREIRANAHLLSTAPDLLDTIAERDATIEALEKALEGAIHALRSYQYHNAATELAERIADHCDAALSLARKGAGT